jgi:hypothetical protein
MNQETLSTSFFDHSMKSAILFLATFLVFTLACTSVKNTENGETKKDNSFTLQRATSQSWTAGIPSGGSGTEYYFDIKITSSKEILFDSVWINNKSFPIFLSRADQGVSSDPVKFVNGDNITLRVSDITNSSKVTSPTKPPVANTGAALVGYKVNGKQVYYIIKEIEKLPSVPRQ